jgi:hypothetical protein
MTWTGVELSLSVPSFRTVGRRELLELVRLLELEGELALLGVGYCDRLLVGGLDLQAVPGKGP